MGPLEMGVRRRWSPAFILFLAPYPLAVLFITFNFSQHYQPSILLRNRVHYHHLVYSLCTQSMDIRHLLKRPYQVHKYLLRVSTHPYRVQIKIQRARTRKFCKRNSWLSLIHRWLELEKKIFTWIALGNLYYLYGPVMYSPENAVCRYASMSVT